MWLHDVHQLIFHRFHAVHSVLVELDLVKDLFCCAYCQQILRLLCLHIRFPLLSIFLDFLPLLSRCRCSFIAFHLFSFLWLEEVINFIFPSLFWSSHWSVCLVHGSEVWVPFCCFHRSSGSDAILIAKRHFNLLCVSTQHWILAAFILSTAVAVLLFMYSIQPSSSISPVSISSSVSFMKEMSLSWSQSVFELLPSAVSSSELGSHFCLLRFRRCCLVEFSFCIFSLRR